MGGKSGTINLDIILLLDILDIILLYILKDITVYLLTLDIIYLYPSIDIKEILKIMEVSIDDNTQAFIW